MIWRVVHLVTHFYLSSDYSRKAYVFPYDKCHSWKQVLQGVFSAFVNFQNEVPFTDVLFELFY